MGSSKLHCNTKKIFDKILRNVNLMQKGFTCPMSIERITVSESANLRPQDFMERAKHHANAEMQLCFTFYKHMRDLGKTRAPCSYILPIWVLSVFSKR